MDSSNGVLVYSTSYSLNFDPVYSKTLVDTQLMV